MDGVRIWRPDTAVLLVFGGATAVLASTAYATLVLLVRVVLVIVVVGGGLAGCIDTRLLLVL